MINNNNIQQTIRSIFAKHNNQRTIASTIIHEVVDDLCIKYNLLWHDTYKMVVQVITDGVFDRWLDFDRRGGLMIMQCNTDMDEEPCPSTQPYSKCPPTLPSVPNHSGVSCQPKDNKQTNQSKATRQDIRAVRAEKPCKNPTCGRMNDLGASQCWFCECLNPTIS